MSSGLSYRKYYGLHLRPQVMRYGQEDELQSAKIVVVRTRGIYSQNLQWWLEHIR